MAYLKWLFGVAGKILLLPTLPVACVLIPIFTRADGNSLDDYDTATQRYKRNFLLNLYIPYDNPIEGDRRFVNSGAPFPNVVTGWKGYVNRAMWMWRNPLYGYNKAVSVTVEPGYILAIRGNPNTSDKYKIRGWMFAELRDQSGKLIAWEWYSNYNYTKKRNVRVRLGWKIKTDKIWYRGFARHVVTINPFDTWG